MARHSKRPSELRCLVGVAYGILALLLASILNKLNETLCTLLSARATNQECGPLPADVIHLLYWAGAAGCAWTCYRAYRDFYTVDYYLDLVSQDDHGRRT